MPLVRFHETVWNTPAHQEILEFVSAALRLGNPALYDIDPGGQRWMVFSDSRFTLDHMAQLGALAAFDVDDLPGDWALPTIILTDSETGQPVNTGRIDRPAAQAQIEALVAGTVVLSDKIIYLENDLNVWQTTLDAQPGLPGTVAAENAPDVAWTVVEG